MNREKGKDEKIKELVSGIVRIVEESELRTDWAGCWFSGSQLDSLRQIYERRGYETARIFQEGRVDRRGNRVEMLKNKLLLQILNKVNASQIDRKTGAYILGKLNQILYERIQKKGGKKDE